MTPYFLPTSLMYWSWRLCVMLAHSAVFSDSASCGASTDRLELDVAL